MQSNDLNVYELINRISLIIKTLRDDVKNVSLDSEIKAIISAMPDAREHLNDVLEMTLLSADKALTGAELATNQQSLLNEQALSLDESWAHCPVDMMSGKNESDLTEKTVKWLGSVPAVISLTRSQLQDIMLAQEYLDLTGQVVNRMSNVLLDLEKKLTEIIPVEKRKIHEKQKDGSFNASVTSQSDLDKLLDGFGM